MVLEAAKLAYANETEESITSHKLGAGDFWWITNNVFNKVNLLYLLYFMTHEVFSFAFDKALLFAKNFSKNSHHDDWGISLPAFPTRTNLKMHNVSITS